MPRIRTIKPEFWESETIAGMSFPARLLFISCLNAADDEGLLRWNAAFLKSFAFVYDDDVLIDQVSEWMDEIVNSNLVLPYKGQVNKGSKQVWYGWIIGFHEHQRINRPSASKYPPPSLQNSDVKAAYADRDHWICQISGKPIESVNERHRGDKNCLSLDHITPKSKGGGDYPSNIRATVQCANKGRGNKDGVNESLNDSLNDSSPEGKGKEGKGTTPPNKLDGVIIEDEKPRNHTQNEPEGFAEFWSVYPRKVGKGEARKRWNKIKPSRELQAKMIWAVEQQKRSADWQRENGKYIPHPATWLNQERWEDEILPSGGRPNGGFVA